MLNCRKPRTFFIQPKAGSTTCFRFLYVARPRFDAIRRAIRLVAGSSPIDDPHQRAAVGRRLLDGPGDDDSLGLIHPDLGVVALLEGREAAGAAGRARTA